MKTNKEQDPILNVNAKYRVSSYSGSFLKRIVLIIVIICGIGSGLFIGIHFPAKTDSNVADSPIGKIIQPSQGTYSGNKVKVAGYVRNIDPDDYVWLVIDAPEKKVCWPQKQVPLEGKSFHTSIDTGRYRNSYILSLYIVDSVKHKEILESLNINKNRDFPMLERSSRLYSILRWKK